MSCSNDDVMIRFDHVTKSYRLYTSDRDRLMDVFRSSKHNNAQKVCAVKDLSFTIRRGEAIAFLGHNGAGKSTTLKMVTGVAQPTSGTVTVNGRVCALLELTAGFDRNLTGRENIHLRGQAAGMSAQEIRELEPKVVKFADLGSYIDQPVRTYSSGMKARLGFAFAVSSDPEILVVDEALSVGDKRFRKKCLRRIRHIMQDENVTVLFVTHASATAQEFCTRGIVLEHGRLRYDGPLDDAIRIYDKSLDED